LFPDSPYAEATGTFKRPVLPPTVDPDASPNRTFTIACEWLPYIRGSLQQLLLQSTWKVDNEAQLILAQARAQTLISMFTECSEVRLPFACPYDFRFETVPSFDKIDETPYVPPYVGTQIFTQGWGDSSAYYAAGNTTLNGIAIQKTFSSAFTCSDIVVKGGYLRGTFSSPYYSLTVAAVHSGSLVALLQFSDTDLPNGNFDFDLVVGDQLVDQVVVELFCAKNTAGIADGAANITHCDVFGLEPSPC
jgi:hypothetical protein